jgi:hypothetical protein
MTRRGYRAMRARAKAAAERAATDATSGAED